MEIKFVALLLLLLFVIDNSMESLAQIRKGRPSRTYPRGLKCVKAQCRERCMEEGFVGGRCRKSKKTLKLGKKKCHCSGDPARAGVSDSGSGVDVGGGGWDGRDGGGNEGGVRGQGRVGGGAGGGHGGWSGGSRGIGVGGGDGRDGYSGGGGRGGISRDGGNGRGDYVGGRGDSGEGGGLDRGGFDGQGADGSNGGYVRGSSAAGGAA